MGRPSDAQDPAATAETRHADGPLLRFDTLWAAAGHPHAVFALSPHDLERLTGAPLADVTEASEHA